MKQIARDIIGELLESGKQTVKQAGAVPGQIVKTAVPGGKASSGQKSGTSVNSIKTSEGKAAPFPPSMPGLETNHRPQGNPGDDQLQQLIMMDNQRRKTGMDNIRAQLTQLKIKRYKEIQQEIQIARKKREEEIPEYIAGKPGAPRTRQEQLEMEEKQKDDAQNQAQAQNGPLLPSGPQSRGSLFFAKQRKGSSELKLGKDG